MGVSNRTLNKMVFKTLSTALLLLPFMTGQPPPPEECWEMKMVGDFEYRFMMEGMPGLPASCMNACIYKRVDNGKMYCFAPGDLHVECEDEDVTDAPDGGEDNSDNSDDSSEDNSDNSDAYCALSSEHTMCKYDGPSESCGATFSGVSEAGKAAILDRHNELRRRVAKGEELGGINPPQPQASNMKKLVWNEELATIAQRLVDQCVFAHDSEIDLLDGTYTGQNLYIASSSAESSESAVQLALANAAQNWYNEVTAPGFDSTGVSSYVFNSGTGHYTQVVWAETGEVGCGF